MGEPRRRRERGTRACLQERTLMGESRRRPLFLPPAATHGPGMPCGYAVSVCVWGNEEREAQASVTGPGRWNEIGEA